MSVLVLDFCIRDGVPVHGMKASIRRLAESTFKPLDWGVPYKLLEGQEWYVPYVAVGLPVWKELYRLQLNHSYGRIIALPVYSRVNAVEIKVIDVIHELWLEPLDQGWQRVVEHNRPDEFYHDQVGRTWRRSSARWYRACSPVLGTVEIVRSKARLIQRLEALCGLRAPVFAETYNGNTIVAA